MPIAAQVRGFRYKFNVFNTPMVISYQISGGTWRQSPKLTFTAANAFAPSVPLFTVEGDGEKSATVKTFANSCAPLRGRCAKMRGDDGRATARPLRATRRRPRLQPSALFPIMLPFFRRHVSSLSLWNPPPAARTHADTSRHRA